LKWSNTYQRHTISYKDEKVLKKDTNLITRLRTDKKDVAFMYIQYICTVHKTWLIHNTRQDNCYFKHNVETFTSHMDRIRTNMAAVLPVLAGACVRLIPVRTDWFRSATLPPLQDRLDSRRSNSHTLRRKIKRVYSRLRLCGFAWDKIQQRGSNCLPSSQEKV
jgi:hypothetical protein